ncbi:MAG: hypothetical protein HY245_11925 [Rhizobiales bacterium]|nr:hypothetical protein [Hyphomicrobiales bacterium]MBI3674095.1 hypothetical protein [Hyphomicrobiales bacterium]
MTLNVIGAGVGRTGTMSLKLALEQLGFGPCHHMEEVIKNPPLHVPLWVAAVQGKPDWKAAFQGYNSAVDWPTAAFWRELAAVNPRAKLILTTRSIESWYASFSETIYKLLGGRDQAPPHMRPLLDMAAGVTAKSGFVDGLDRDGIVGTFKGHADAVKKSIPADRLLVFEVKDGWPPLCRFLGRPIPAAPFPKSNNKEEFWDRIKGSK